MCGGIKDNQQTRTFEINPRIPLNYDESSKFDTQNDQTPLDGIQCVPFGYHFPDRVKKPAELYALMCVLNRLQLDIGFLSGSNTINMKSALFETQAKDMSVL